MFTVRARHLLIAGWLLSVFTFSPSVFGKYTPEHPEVKQMIDRGLQFLSTYKPADVPGASHTEAGARIIIGYAAHKAGRDESDPLVREGVRIALNTARRPIETPHEFTLYEAVMATLLLVDMDPKAYKSDIEKLITLMLRFQKPHGGWGYYREMVGDTSQTQYAILALWAADRTGASVPAAPMERGLAWLLRTQDLSGGFDYHPEDVGRRSAKDLRHSLAFAGLGTALIAGDFFQFYQGTGETAEDLGLPKAFRRIRKDVKKRVTSIKPEQIEASVRQGMRFLETVSYKRDPMGWHYYQAYAAERFYSFYELSKGFQDPEPAWYDAWVEDFKRGQAGDGSWAHANDKTREGQGVGTAFAILFLVRSTKKAIGEIKQGMTVGGFELPKSTKNAKMTDEGVKGDPIANSLNDMLKMLEDDDAQDINPNEIPPALPLDKDPESRKRQLARLERLARGQTGNNTNAYLARRVAVQTLVQADDLSVVPTLIYALTDPDLKVQKLARDGLRMLSRRFEGFGMSDAAESAEVVREQRRWKEWYLGLVPGYVFVD